MNRQRPSPPSRCPVTSGEWHVTRNLTRAAFFLSPVTRHPSPVGGSLRPGADISPSPTLDNASRFMFHVSPRTKITKRTQFQNGASAFPSSGSNTSDAFLLPKRTQIRPNISRKESPDWPRLGGSPRLGADISPSPTSLGIAQHPFPHSALKIPQ